VTLLRNLGVTLLRGDVRIVSDLDDLPKVDWVIDCAANPSVLAGLDGQVSSRQVMEHNLLGTINLLQYCKKHGAGLILLRTSRVYSAKELSQLPVNIESDSFTLNQSYSGSGISPKGISETFVQGQCFRASAKAAERLLSLPIHPHLTDSEISRILEGVCRFFG